MKAVSYYYYFSPLRFLSAI